AAAAAVVMDLSATHRGHHSDSMVPTLASLYGWEPFFWMTDRNGLLLALLTRPIHHPLANLLVQFGLSVFAGVAALGLVARYLNPGATWPAVGAGAWALLLYAGGEYERFNMLNPCQPYAVSLFLAAAGLLLAGYGRWWAWLAAVGLFALVGWVNLGLAMNLGPWLVARRLMAGVGTAATVRGLLLLALGTGVGLWLQRFSEHHDTRLGFAAVAQWRAGWEGVAKDVREHYESNLVATAGLLVVGLGWRLLPATRTAARPAFRDALAAAAAFAVAFTFLGTTEWAAMNAYSSRYLFPSIFLLNVAAAGAALGPPLSRLAWAKPRAVAVGAALLLPAMTLGVYGWPSVAAARAAVDESTGHHTADVLELRCTHVSGEYWDVWLAVFHANLVRYERGEDGVVWGLAFRAAPTQKKWSAVPPADVRIGWLVRPGASGPPGETAPWWMSHYPKHHEAARTPRVVLLVAP
ncbi:MAG TPA: hypothetical protein VD866_32145, partial [Urbifossiella sp.]|nr:hypothetical protein [Urbifossiella sp.]